MNWRDKEREGDESRKLEAEWEWRKDAVWMNGVRKMMRVKEEGSCWICEEETCLLHSLVRIVIIIIQLFPFRILLTDTNTKTEDERKERRILSLSQPLTFFRSCEKFSLTIHPLSLLVLTQEDGGHLMKALIKWVRQKKAESVCLAQRFSNCFQNFRSEQRRNMIRFFLLSPSLSLSYLSFSILMKVTNSFLE